MTNVITLSNHRRDTLLFSTEDRRYLSDMCKAFNRVELPHELIYGQTDEHQEWCLVRKLIRRRERSEWTSRTVIVAEITVTAFGYRHAGNWGIATATTLKELFAQLMPSAYDEVREGVH